MEFLIHSCRWRPEGKDDSYWFSPVDKAKTKNENQPFLLMKEEESTFGQYPAVPVEEGRFGEGTKRKMAIAGLPLV
jgi:hypothetical protein